LDYARLFHHVGIRYQPDALLVCVYANDVANTSEHAEPSGIYHEYGWLRRASYQLWPRTTTLLRQIRREQERERTATLGFVATVTEEAERRGVDPARTRAWKERVPPELAKAVDDGALNGLMLSRGLFRPDVWIDAIDLESDQAKRKYAAMESILSAMRSMAERRGIWFGVVYIPSRFQYEAPGENTRIWKLGGVRLRPGWRTEDESEFQRRLRRWAAPDGAFLDLTPVLRRATDASSGLNYRHDDHWTPAGHRVVATAIAEWLGAAWKNLPSPGSRSDASK
jgi:hypothetical protein